MEFVSVVLFQEHLVRYKVRSEDGIHFMATLIGCKKDVLPKPPVQVMLHYKDSEWWGDCDKELLDFLVYDIISRIKKMPEGTRNKTVFVSQIYFQSAIHPKS